MGTHTHTATPTCNSREGSGCPEQCCCKLLSPSAYNKAGQGGCNNWKSKHTHIVYAHTWKLNINITIELGWWWFVIFMCLNVCFSFYVNTEALIYSIHRWTQWHFWQKPSPGVCSGLQPTTSINQIQIDKIRPMAATLLTRQVRWGLRGHLICCYLLVALLYIVYDGCFLRSVMCYVWQM